MCMSTKGYFKKVHHKKIKVSISNKTKIRLTGKEAEISVGWVAKLGNSDQICDWRRSYETEPIWSFAAISLSDSFLRKS